MALARYRGVAQDSAGNVIPNATVEVRRDQAGRPVVPLFSDRNGTIPLGNPITANELGQFGFHAPGGVYYVRVFTGPSQAPFQEFIARYVAIGTAAERDVEELASSLNSGMGIFATFEGLELFTPEAGNVGARVINDPDPALNGDYIYVTDEWVKQRGLPDTLARMEVTGGTADAIEATISTGIDPAAVVMMLLTPEAANTGPVTVNGIDLIAFDGAPLEAGWLEPGVPVFLFVNDDGDYQLTSDVRYQTLAAQALVSRNQAVASEAKAEQWADNAEDVAVETGQFSAKHHAIKAAASGASASDSATTATTQAGIATWAAGDAVEAKDAAEALYGDLEAVAQAKEDAVAAAEGSGISEWFDTKALATAALEDLTEQQVIGVFSDESKDGAQVIYRVETGALVEKIDAEMRTQSAVDNRAGSVSLFNYPAGALPTTTADVQDAVDTARLKGGAVEVPSGSIFEIDDTIVLTDVSGSQNPLRLVNSGAKGGYYGNRPAVFKRASGFAGPLFSILGRGVEFDGITVDGDRLPGHLVQVERGFEIAFRRSRFIGAYGYGIWGRALSNVLIDACHFDECGWTNDCTDGAMTAASTAFTSASTSFDERDIGATITVPGAGDAGADLKTSIAALVSEHVVTLRTAASTTVSGASCIWDCAALRLSGNSSYEYAANTTILRSLHLERNRSIDLDLGWGDDVDDYAEFTLISGLHIEAGQHGGTDPTSDKSRPLIRAGNVRGVYASDFYLYGGSGPHLLYDKQRDTGASATNGVSFVNGRMLGHITSHAVDSLTPDRLVDLERGDEAKFTDVQFDTALTEHIRIRSTFGANVSIKGDTHTARSGSTSTWVTDDRADNDTVRKPTRLNGWISYGDTLIEKAGAALSRVASGAGFAALVRFRSGTSDRWDIGKTADAEAGSNAGSDFAITRRSDAGANLGVALLISRATGLMTLAGDFLLSQTQNALAQISGGAGFVAQLRFLTGTSGRWYIGRSADTESGSNAGSNFVINRRTDAGASNGDVVTINRQTGITTFLGVAIPSKAGVPSDADYAATPPVGTMVIDTTNHRLYLREAGGVWKYTTLT